MPAVIELERKQDDRGFFARTFDRAEFAAAGLEPLVEQANLSFNHLAGTLRGMHYQVAPATEAKLVRCTAGAVLDVIVDVRRGLADLPAVLLGRAERREPARRCTSRRCSRTATRR